MTPAVAGEHVYVGSCAGSFYAFDRSTGEVAWSYDTEQDGAAAQFHGDVLVTDELVVVGADARPQAHLYAFERADGSVRWKLPFPGGVTSQVLRHGDNALAVAANGEVVAVELETGTPRWLVEGPEGAGGRLVRDPALDGGRLFVGWMVGVVDAYDAATGELLWRRELGAPVNTSVALFAGEVVIGTREPDGGRLVRLDPAGGEVLGRIDPGGMPYGDPRPLGGCLVSAVAEGGEEGGRHDLTCIDPVTGEARWRVRAEGDWSTARPLVLGEQVVAGHEGRLVGISAADGALLWERRIEGVPRGLGASDEHLVYGTLGGDVRALRWRESPEAPPPRER